MGTREECMRELAEWFAKHRRHMTRRNMRPIVDKYFPTDAEAAGFHQWLSSAEGQSCFRNRLREELDKRQERRD